MAYDIFKRQQISRDWSCGHENDARQQAITKWNASLKNHARDIETKYATPGPTNRELFEDIDKNWQLATKFTYSSESIISSLPKADSDEAEDNAIALLELRAKVKALPPDAQADEAIRKKATVLMSAPYKWFARIGTPVLTRKILIDDLTKQVTDTPSAILKYLLDQLRKTLSLPSWFIPAVATTAVVGLGAWAYFTFLAPLTRATKRIA